MLRDQFAAMQAAHAGVGGGVGVPPGGMMNSFSAAGGAGGGGMTGPAGGVGAGGMFPRPGTASQPLPTQGYAPSGVQVGPAGAMPAIPPTGLPPGMSMMYNSVAAQQRDAQGMGRPMGMGMNMPDQGQQPGQQVGASGQPQQMNAQGMPGMMQPGMTPLSLQQQMRRTRAPTAGASGLGQTNMPPPNGPLQLQTPTSAAPQRMHPGVPRPEPTNPHQRVSILPPVPSLPGTEPPEPDYTYGGSLPELSEGEIAHVKDWMERDDAWANALRDPERAMRERAERAELGTPRGWWAREAVEAAREQQMGGPAKIGFEILWPGERRRREALRDQQRERERETRTFSHALPFSSGAGTPVNRSRKNEPPGFIDRAAQQAAAATAAAAGSATIWALPPTQAREQYAVIAQRREYKPSKEMLREADGKGEVLVPIRLEVEHDHYRFRDTFVWNVHDPIMTPDLFAQTICDDFHLPLKDFFPLIKDSVLKQLQEAGTFDFSPEDTVLPGPDGVIDLIAGEMLGVEGRGKLGEKDRGWWEGWRRRLRAKIGRKGKFAVRGDEEEGDVEEDSERDEKRKRGEGIGDDMDIVELPSVQESAFVKAEEIDIELEPAKPVDELEGEITWTAADHELRVLIKLDITYGVINLTDQFEWDINNTSVSPEMWAESYAADLGLAPEFKTAIAHDIREQVQVMRKSLIISGHPLEGPVLDAELRTSFLPPLLPTYLTRNADEAMHFTPILSHLTEAEIAREEAEREKEARRRKRQTRGRRGVQQLPDREPLKTQRSIPLVGSMAPREQVPLVPVLTSRRAAAAAATANIAKDLPQPEQLERTGPAPPALVGPTLSLPPRKKSQKAVEEVAAAEAAATNSEGATAQKTPAERQRPATKKQLREKEREAKEMEYADTQKENVINGIWHCSNCGCPESIAVGRRKGPLGEKTMCGACGKYWHRYRRPREVEYNTSEEYHRNLRDAEEAAKRGTKYKKKPTALASLEAETPDIEMLEAPPVEEGVPEEVEAIPTLPTLETAPPAGTLTVEDASKPSHPSPAFADMPFGESSDEEFIVAVPRTPTKSSSTKPVSTDTAAPPETSPVLSSTKPPSPSKPKTTARIPKPKWLADAYEALMAKYPNDRIEIVPKANADPNAPAEWKVKCLDCPGKLYNTGPPKQNAPPPEPGKNPEETLSGFEVHLKNRNHRRGVETRLSGKPLVPGS